MTSSVMNGGLAMLATHYFLPSALRGNVAAAAAQRVERMAKNLQAVKQNKVDLRQLLALPVYDPAHPYYLEKPWEVYFKNEQPPVAKSTTGQLRKVECLTIRASTCADHVGLFQDDLSTEWMWATRMAIRRLPKDQREWRERRTITAHLLEGSGGVGHLPTQYWLHPADDVAYLQPYISMASDEMEEKWGFMAGEENCY
eukprot:TRINITY_DN44005_c0_g1_i1.p1 TRINITY_DN44005_c0_g1~~TRINITY_DN44005_c0_g1_i1.p1  ORF type:complete len:199 (+),score=60.32 TRINITY_DN44005_c0_g1_i1:59-655(+)